MYLCSQWTMFSISEYGINARLPENIQSVLIGGRVCLGRAWRCHVSDGTPKLSRRIAERFPPGNLSSLPITVRTIKANNSTPGRGEGSSHRRPDLASGQDERNEVSTLHIFECVSIFPGLPTSITVMARSLYGRPSHT